VERQGVLKNLLDKRISLVQKEAQLVPVLPGSLICGVATMAETRNRIQDSRSYDGLEIRLDGPMPLRSSDHFTFFWRGSATVEGLRDFIDHVPTYPDEGLRTLFFFPRTRLYLPPSNKAFSSSALEAAIIGVYGPPRFLRYEIYPDETLRSDLKHTRYVTWGSMQPGPSSEVGVFTTVNEFTTQAFDSPLQMLLRQTARTVPEHILATIINDLHQLLKGRVSL